MSVCWPRSFLCSEVESLQFWDALVSSVFCLFRIMNDRRHCAWGHLRWRICHRKLRIMWDTPWFYLLLSDHRYHRILTVAQVGFCKFCFLIQKSDNTILFLKLYCLKAVFCWWQVLSAKRIIAIEHLIAMKVQHNLENKLEKVLCYLICRFINLPSIP